MSTRAMKRRKVRQMCRWHEFNLYDLLTGEFEGVARVWEATRFVAQEMGDA